MPEAIINGGDEALAEMLEKKDDGALKELEARYGKYLYGIISNYLSDPEEISECLNDVYLKIWKDDKFASAGEFKSYISKIARNTAVDRHRENERQKRVAVRRSQSIDDTDEDFLKAPSAEEEYYTERLKKLLNGFVASLPERRRYIFTSRYYFQYGIKDIAETLGVSESTVNKELFKIKKSLKKLLEREE